MGSDEVGTEREVGMAWYKVITLLDTFLAGTMRREESDVKVLLLVLIAEADRTGGVFGSWDYLAFRCGWEREPDRGKARFEAAMERLMAPDPESTCPLEGGRRVVREGPNQYRLVTYRVQQEKLRQLAERAREAEKKRRQRARKPGADAVAGGSSGAEPAAAQTEPVVAEASGSTEGASAAKGTVRKTRQERVEALGEAGRAFFRQAIQLLNRGKERAEFKDEILRFVDFVNIADDDPEAVFNILDWASHHHYWADKLPQSFNGLPIPLFKEMYRQWDEGDVVRRELGIDGNGAR